MEAALYGVSRTAELFLFGIAEGSSSKEGNKKGNDPRSAGRLALLAGFAGQLFMRRAGAGLINRACQRGAGGFGLRLLDGRRTAGFRLGVRFGGDRAAVGVAGLAEGDLTLAAITAAKALFAEVIVARVLGATGANSRGFLITNAAHEGHGSGYFFLPEGGG